jgi:hypothetical protein
VAILIRSSVVPTNRWAAEPFSVALLGLFTGYPLAPRLSLNDPWTVADWPSYRDCTTRLREFQHAFGTSGGSGAQAPEGSAQTWGVGPRRGLGWPRTFGSPLFASPSNHSSQVCGGFLNRRMTSATASPTRFASS